MKAGDLLLYTPNQELTPDNVPSVGIVLKLTPSGTKASVLWSDETVGIFFSIRDLERYPKNFKLVSK